MRRRLAEGAFPNAVRDEAGAWTIPVEDLLAAGLRLGRPSRPPDPVTGEVSGSTEQGDHGPVSGVLADRVHELETLLSLERERRQGAERVAEERQRHLQTALTALRMLEAGPRPGAGVTSEPSPGWWARRRRRNRVQRRAADQAASVVVQGEQGAGTLTPTAEPRP